MKVIDQTTSSRSILFYSDSSFDDVSSKVLYINNILITSTDPGNTSTIWYQNLSGNFSYDGRSVIRINNLNSGTCYNITGTFFSNPSIELWSDDFNSSDLDKGLDGGNWVSGQIVNATGSNDFEHIFDGDTFMSPNIDFAPEEFVPGHTTDSLGINVYTTNNEVFALVRTGTFPINDYNTTTVNIAMQRDDITPGGFFVNFNGRIFDRTTNTNFTNSSQFFVQGNQLVIPPQSNIGRASYSFITVGGAGILDSVSVGTFYTTTNYVIVQSSAFIKDVKSVYVLVDGKEVNKITTTTDYGYMIKPTYQGNQYSEENNRAAVYVYNLPPNFHTVSAWFFNTESILFNKITEEYFNVTGATTSFTLSFPPSSWQPYSDKAIVEVGSSQFSGSRIRLEPPPVSNYFIENNQRIFKFFDSGNNSGVFNANDIMVYANGVRIRSGYDFNFNFTNNTIELTQNLYPNGTYISITCIKHTGPEYDYIITDNLLTLKSAISTSTVKVTSFSNHNNLFMETEKFSWNVSRRFMFIRPILDDNYIWVYVDGRPLVHRQDFIVLDDMRTVEIANNISFVNPSEVLITSIKQPESYGKIYGFRIFNDFYDRSSYKRLSRLNTTNLTEYLFQKDSKIHVLQDSNLSPSNDSKNIPGVVLIDRERIEFFGSGNNTLYNLRRGTGGTGPSTISQPGTKVIDQGILQNIPDSNDRFYTYITTSTNTTTYNIPYFNTSTGIGITLDTNIEAVNQIKVFYGGKILNKTFRNVMLNWDSMTVTTLLPEFSVNTSSQSLILNIGDRLEPGVTISVVQKKGKIWTGTESLMTSEVKQAKFLRQREAELPDLYFYGGDARLLDTNYEPFVDDNNEIYRIE